MIFTRISKNVGLYSKSSQNSKKLVVMLTWLGAQDKTILKYVNLYQDSDVLVVKINLKESLWPTRGSQVIAKTVATFLDQNPQFEKIVLHGFSVGGYVWGETLLQLKKKENFDLVVGKIVGQVWDSIIDPLAATHGVAYVVAPNHKIIGFLIIFLLGAILRLTYYFTLYYYTRSNNIFRSNIVSAPALLFYCENDEIGANKCIQKLEKDWEKLKIDMEVQCWDNSTHVGHFLKYPKEYTNKLKTFLKKVGFN